VCDQIHLITFGTEHHVIRCQGAPRGGVIAELIGDCGGLIALRALRCCLGHGYSLPLLEGGHKQFCDKSATQIDNELCN
jgi:hypothetical protein